MLNIRFFAFTSFPLREPVFKCYFPDVITWFLVTIYNALPVLMTFSNKQPKVLFITALHWRHAKKTNKKPFPLWKNQINMVSVWKEI